MTIHNLLICRYANIKYNEIDFANSMRDKTVESRHNKWQLDACSYKSHRCFFPLATASSFASGTSKVRKEKIVVSNKVCFPKWVKKSWEFPFWGRKNRLPSKVREKRWPLKMSEIFFRSSSRKSENRDTNLWLSFIAPSSWPLSFSTWFQT